MDRGRLRADTLTVIVLAALLALCVAGTGMCKPAPSAAKGKKATVQTTKWVKVCFHGISFDAPEKWRPFLMAPENGVGRYLGESEATPLVGFICMFEKPENLDRLFDIGVTRKRTVTVAGIKATEHRFHRKSDDCDGVLIVSEKKYADGTRFYIAAVSQTGQWKKYEPVLRKMIASVKVDKSELDRSKQPEPKSTGLH
jgi:hypothetical protein